MKIKSVEQFFPGRRMRFVKIITDNGLVGWGETTLEGRPRSTVAAVEEISDYLVGKDPLRIEHHWQHIYRSAFYRGGSVLMTALSGIDQALWDIAGKHHGVPVHALLGGHVRDRIRVYAHWGIRDMSEEGLSQARERLDALVGTGAYKAFKSGPGGAWRAHEPPAVIDAFVKCAFTMREWVGPETELCFDFHGKMTPGHRDLQRAQGHATHVCRGAGTPGKRRRPQARFGPRAVSHRHGRAATDSLGFPRDLREAGRVADPARRLSRGGISELKRVANMAEVYYMHTMPHCAIGPVAFAACLQVDAAVPNFLIQEQVDAGLGEGILKAPWKVVEGHIALPARPGLGIEVDESVLRDPHVPQEELGGKYYHASDGSVADW